MKKLLLLVMVGVLCLTACQQEQAPTASLSEPQREASSVVLAESPAKAESPDTEPVVSQTPPSAVPQPLVEELSTTVKILMEYDKPVIYAMPEKGAELGMAAQLDRYMEWISSLVASEVTAIHAYSAPTFEYTAGEMTLADSNTLFKALKSMKPTVLPVSEFGNPPTGGGWSIAVQTANEKAVIFFNGSWLVIYFDGEETAWIFNTEENGTDDIGYAIDTQISENMNNGSGKQPSLLYKGEAVKNIYALNSNFNVMARISEHATSKQILAQLEDYKPTAISPDGLGYLIFTEKGKTYIYLDDTNAALTKTCSAALANTPLHPSWLIHMTPDRLVSANGVTDKAVLLKLCDFLKENVTVQDETSTHKGASNPNMVMGLYTLKLEFDSGVFYNLIGYDYFDTTGSFSLYASDLDTIINYKCNSGVSSELRSYLASMK